MISIEILKALNNITKKINKINGTLGVRIEEFSKKNAESAADAQNAAIELDLDLSQRLADIENALCELSED